MPSAKVLLFGEHTVLCGGRGLAVPLPEFSLEWEWADEPDPRLLKFCAYLRRELAGQLSIDGLERDLQDGRYLEGNILPGYGLGSSGAVCAAVLEDYGPNYTRELPLTDLRRLLARMESFFHGSSSGTDPLVCYLDRPMLLGPGGEVRTVSLPDGWRRNFFLVDTGPRRRTADRVIDDFLTAYASERKGSIDRNWRAASDAAIEAVLAGDRDQLEKHFHRLSEYQRREFPNFFPAGYHDRNLKLCGAGGGGMLLGLVPTDGNDYEEQDEKMLLL